MVCTRWCACDVHRPLPPHIHHTSKPFFLRDRRILVVKCNMSSINREIARNTRKRTVRIHEGVDTKLAPLMTKDPAIMCPNVVAGCTGAARTLLRSTRHYVVGDYHNKSTDAANYTSRVCYGVALHCSTKQLFKQLINNKKVNHEKSSHVGVCQLTEAACIT